MLGSGAMTNSIEEVVDNDTIFVIGSNTTEAHPVIGASIKQAVKKGAKLIVADPVRIKLSEIADCYLQIQPGSNTALLNGMINYIIENNLQDHEYIDKKVNNFEALKESVKECTLEKTAEICGVDAELIAKAARIYAESPAAGLYYAMGITQHSTGVDNVKSTVNIALVCGNIGKANAGVNPLRGQNNVQGACDMGALPNKFPGYQDVINPEAIDKFQDAWGVKLNTTNGMRLPEMMDKAANGELGFMYIVGENPMISDPDTHHVTKALKTVDFLVVQDIFLTETAELADVVLPAATFAEKDGTFTNTERRVQRVRKAINPIGNSKPDWLIFSELLEKFGIISKNKYNTSKDIFEELSSLTPQYNGISYGRIDSLGLQWPCPTKDHPGTQFLHKDKFMKGEKVEFMPVKYRDPIEKASKQYPIIMTTGRILEHYHTRTMTMRTDEIDKEFKSSWLSLSPELAKELEIDDKDNIVVNSPRGKIFTVAKISNDVSGKTVFMPFHFGNGANVLTNGQALDPICGIPELKVTAINISKA